MVAKDMFKKEEHKPTDDNFDSEVKEEYETVEDSEKNFSKDDLVKIFKREDKCENCMWWSYYKKWYKSKLGECQYNPPDMVPRPEKGGIQIMFRLTCSIWGCGAWEKKGKDHRRWTVREFILPWSFFDRDNNHENKS